MLGVTVADVNRAVLDRSRRVSRSAQRKLVRRHSLAIAEHRVYFPIADSEEALLKNGGAPLLQQLPEEDPVKSSVKYPDSPDF
jgi:hypothetical protein